MTPRYTRPARVTSPAVEGIDIDYIAPTIRRRDVCWLCGGRPDHEQPMNPTDQRAADLHAHYLDSLVSLGKMTAQERDDRLEAAHRAYSNPLELKERQDAYAKQMIAAETRARGKR